MKVMNMPMMDMPMMNMPMMSMPMMNMPMMNMAMEDEDVYDDKYLKEMYPEIYIRIYPMVRSHCDMMESMHGAMYCPSKEEMDHICKEVYEKQHRDCEDDDERYDNDDTRQIFGGRRGLTQDLIRILLIRDLLGRRRRRRPYFGY